RAVDLVLAVPQDALVALVVAVAAGEPSFGLVDGELEVPGESREVLVTHLDARVAAAVAGALRAVVLDLPGLVSGHGDDVDATGAQVYPGPATCRCAGLRPAPDVATCAGPSAPDRWPAAGPTRAAAARLRPVPAAGAPPAWPTTARASRTRTRRTGRAPAAAASARCAAARPRLSTRPPRRRSRRSRACGRRRPSESRPDRIASRRARRAGRRRSCVPADAGCRGRRRGTVRARRRRRNSRRPGCARPAAQH